MKTISLSQDLVEDGTEPCAQCPDAQDHTLPYSIGNSSSIQAFPASDDHQGNPTETSVCDNGRQLLSFLLKKTIPWVGLGIVFMLAGIITLFVAFLPRIYTCAPGATCPRSFDPRGQILRVVQTIMLYWLQGGCLIAGVGLFKLVAYHAWFVMKRRGTAIENLDLQLGTIHGSAWKATILVWNRRDVFLGVLALTHLVILTAIPFIVNRSLSELSSMGRVRVTFAYLENFTIPGNWVGSLSMVKIYIAMNAWLLGDKSSHPFDTFHGSFVLRDNRTLHAVDAQPGGPRITGTVFCSAENISSMVLPPSPPDQPDTEYNITYGRQWMKMYQNVFGSAFLGEKQRPMISSDNTTVYLHLLWASSNTARLINSTTTSDGRVNLAHCIHTIDMSPIRDEHLDHIQPSRFVPPQEKLAGLASVCVDGLEELCLKIYIGYALLVSWAAYSERPFPASGELVGTIRNCRRGALTGLVDHPDATCVVDDKSWTGILSILAEAVLEASEKAGIAKQELWTDAESTSRTRWWLQSTVPASILALYIISVAHVFYLNKSQPRYLPKELSVRQVVRTAVQERPVRDYARQGIAVDRLWVGGGFKVRTGHWIGGFPKPLLHARPDHPTTSPNGGSHVVAAQGQFTPLPARTDRDENPSLNLTPEPGTRSASASHWFILVFSATAPTVLSGVLFMFTGIIIFRFAILPRVYTCPPGAVCPGSFDPRGQILRILQTVMLYWLHTGCVIAGIGLMNVIAYQAWFTMVKTGTTIRSLEIKLAAVHGNAFRTAFLVFERSNRSIALFCFIQIVISSMIALVVNRSISNLQTTGRVRVKFTYPQLFTLSGVSLPGVTDPMLSFSQPVIDGYFEWLSGDNRTHPFDQYSDTLVFRDNRTILALDSQPGGSRVTGTISCSSTNISSIILSPPSGSTETAYNITYNNRWALATSSQFLDASFVQKPYILVSNENYTTVVVHLLWITNQPGTITNGTLTNDGKSQMATCNHTITLVPILRDHKEDFLQPSTLFLTPNARNGSHPACASGSTDDVCLALIIAHFFFRLLFGFRLDSLPNGQLPAMRTFCRRGAWSTFGDLADKTCRVDEQAWTLTLAALTDALLQTSNLSRDATQDLWVGAESISRSQWWWQAVIPCATLCLYVMSMGYLVYLDPGLEVLKKLNLTEIVTAAAADAAPDRGVLEQIKRGGLIDSVAIGGERVLDEEVCDKI